jgi:hypothetical protein
VQAEASHPARAHIYQLPTVAVVTDTLKP